ncbi:hypothetical protein HanXRQr2_Chr06g0270331 [Helianthus annuus]|uniref:Uncharacterized protein n=2 Tax=Helianthus annuus TaxID=4232 RepID=A0A9K3IVE3_HELAN|nr:hypothetical protein HanXRQr2_Chr06g0270331 [Helianthus annuus]KAJ0916374.1 hypothetical protein HanPSC8_Chr06g0260911 [Helianthus annuus]
MMWHSYLGREFCFRRHFPFSPFLFTFLSGKMNLGILQTFNTETSHMLFIRKVQSIISQLKIFSKITNTFPLLSLIYSLCLTRGFKRELSSPYSSFFHHSANLNHR